MKKPNCERCGDGNIDLERVEIKKVEIEIDGEIHTRHDIYIMCCECKISINFE